MLNLQPPQDILIRITEHNCFKKKRVICNLQSFFFLSCKKLFFSGISVFCDIFQPKMHFFKSNNAIW